MSKRSRTPQHTTNEEHDLYAFDLPTTDSHSPVVVGNSDAASTSHGAHSHSNAYDLPISSDALEGLQMAQVIALATQNNVAGASGAVQVSDDVQVGSSKDMDVVEQGFGTGVDEAVHASLFEAVGEGSGTGEVEKTANGKKKRKKAPAGPRTNRACLPCRKQKMRCEGADDPPCKRCKTHSLECIFERRADYMLNPEDSAWQNKISTQISTLSSTVDRILQALESHGIVVPPAPADPTTASTSATPAPVGSIEVGGGGGEVTEDVGVGVDVGDYSAWTGDEPTGYEGEG